MTACEWKNLFNPHLGLARTLATSLSSTGEGLLALFACLESLRPKY